MDPPPPFFPPAAMLHHPLSLMQSPHTSYQGYDPLQENIDLGFRFETTSTMQLHPIGFQIGPIEVPHSLSPPQPPMSQHDRDMDSMEDIQTIIVPSMGPPSRPRKRKATTIRADAWVPYKARILELHIEQKIPLKKVIEVIKDEFGFTAGLRQYRTRITQWGKDKNIKNTEMKAIVRKNQERKLLHPQKGPLAFEVRDIEVETEKIERWMKRNNIIGSSLYTYSPAPTPADVVCYTISDRGSPAIVPESSPLASVMSPGSMRSIPNSPQAFSPALSIAHLIQPQTSIFVGESPRPAYRSLAPAFSTEPPSPHRYKQAKEERLLERLKNAEEMFGEEHDETLSILRGLCVVWTDQGRYKSAEHHARRLVGGRKSLNGTRSAQTIDALRLLGKIYGHQGRYAEAQELLVKLLPFSTVVLGSENLSTLSIMDNLLDTYGITEAFNKAEELGTRLMDISKRVRGLEERKTVDTISYMSYVYLQQGQLIKAEGLAVQAMDSARKIWGYEDVLTLDTMTHVAIVYSEQGRWSEAEILETEVLEISKKVLGEEHPDTLTTAFNLAGNLYNLGRINEAVSMMDSCFKIQRRVLGPNHPRTKDSLECVSDWREELGLDRLDD
ncbi:hypothetical protein B0J11DRAFT_148585 [Dendryphion nanum]|uniref:Clr5 domain-containing protein n=1 Tax=Dendryphion nanum TaxID=256645 RepID=A0A9P9ED89_9PLEO|nr:hypothetical protein B0J11DRAFT_148585 [Dendryphion nanum]